MKKTSGEPDTGYGRAGFAWPRAKGNRRLFSRSSQKRNFGFANGFLGTAIYDGAAEPSFEPVNAAFRFHRSSTAAVVPRPPRFADLVGVGHAISRARQVSIRVNGWSPASPYLLPRRPEGVAPHQ